MDLTQLFIQNLKKWRKNRGFSQKKLAELCNAAHSYIRQIESGKGHPSFVFTEKLAKALNIEPYRLFYEETTAESSAKLKKRHLIKKDFLEKAAQEFDAAFNKLAE